MQKAKYLSKEGLQIGEKRREVEKQRSKGKIFECRIPKNSKGDKKAFFSDQCKEIEENKRMRKTRNLLKTIRDTNRTSHAKIGT